MSDLFPNPTVGAKGAFVADLIADTTTTGVFLVTRKDLRQKQNGDPYLSLTLADRSGQVEGAMWDQVTGVQGEFQRDDFIKVRGFVSVYRDRLQIKIEKLRRIPDVEVNLAEFLPATTADVNALWTELCGRVAAMKNRHLQALLERVLADPEVAERYRRAPAAKTLHHACLGGLLEHVSSLCRLATPVLRHYDFLDADLVLTGIVLHDLGKIYELDYDRSFRYTTEGQLLGHMILVLELLHRHWAAMPDFPPRLRVVVEHLVVSHHGHYEFGSPKLPMFPEALLLHHLDDLDSKMNAMHAQLLQERVEGEWTGYNRSLERPLLRLHEWLAAGDKPATADARAVAADAGAQSAAAQAARLQAAWRGSAAPGEEP